MFKVNYILSNIYELLFKETLWSTIQLIIIFMIIMFSYVRFCFLLLFEDASVLPPLV